MLLTATIVIILSFFSAGIPEYAFICEGIYRNPVTTEGVLLYDCLPLSYPFYSSIYSQPPLHMRDSVWDEYRFNFLNMTLNGTRIFIASSGPAGVGGVVLSFSLLHYVLYFSVFLMVNIAGAALGYLISRKRWFAASILIGIVIVTPLVLLYNPISPVWNPPRPEVTAVQTYWSDLVFVVNATIKNNGGDGPIKILVTARGSGASPLSELSSRGFHFSRWETKILQFTFEGLHPPATYSVRAVAD